MDAVLLPDAVRAHPPARLVQQGGGPLRVIRHLGRRVVPRQLVTDAVGGRAVAVQHVVNHLLPVDPDVDRPAHPHVGGKVVAHRAPVGVRPGGNGGQVKSPVVHRAVGGQGIAVHRLVGIRGGGIGHIHLPGLRSQERRVLLHKQDRDPLHLGRFAVVVRVGLQNDLLAAVPLL